MMFMHVCPRSGHSESRAFSSHSAWVFMEASNTLFVVSGN